LNPSLERVPHRASARGHGREGPMRRKKAGDALLRIPKIDEVVEL
jgi:hypothetical protein